MGIRIANMEPHGSNDLGLAGQTSSDESELQRILGLAFKAIDNEEHQKPSAPPNSPSVKPPKQSARGQSARGLRGQKWRGWRVTQMLSMVAQLTCTAHSVNRMLLSKIISSRLSAWRTQSRKAFWPSIMLTLARDAFEAEDRTCTGSLSRGQATRAYLSWLTNLKSELGEVAEELKSSGLELCRTLECVNFREFQHAIAQTAFPVALQPAVLKFSTGIQCICGVWMTQICRKDCYPGGGVTCDFTGDVVSAATVWHCERHRAEAAHPFGFDVAEESREPFLQFKMHARLFDRLNAGQGLDDVTPASRMARGLVHELKKAECITELLPHARNMFLTIKDYISMLVSANAKPEALVKLKKRYAWCKSVLEHEDWTAKKAEAVKQVQQTLQSLDQLTADLAHDKLKFKDISHRASEIKRFEKEFNPAERHRNFEKSTETYKQLCSVAKDIDGLEACNMDDPDVAQLLAVFSDQILRHLLSRRALPMIGVLSAKHKQNSKGICFKWIVAVPGGKVALEHQVGLDNTDVEHAKMHRQYMGLYHGVQERLRALEHCATEADLLSQLCEFTIEDGDSAIGEICVMCQEDMCCGEQALKINTCGHAFHDECVRPWFLGCKHECPVCKAPVITGSKQPTKKSVELRNESAQVRSQFEDGARVVVDGLVSRADLNGATGQISGFNQQTGRYAVRTEHGVLSVLGRNLNLNTDVSESLNETTVDDETVGAQPTVDDETVEAQPTVDDEELEEAMALSMEAAVAPAALPSSIVSTPSLTATSNRGVTPRQLRQQARIRSANKSRTSGA